LVERSPAGLGVDDFKVGGVRVLDAGSKFHPSRDSKVDALRNLQTLADDLLYNEDRGAGLAGADYGDFSACTLITCAILSFNRVKSSVNSISPSVSGRN
jgi:hypothetical protein